MNTATSPTPTDAAAAVLAEDDPRSAANIEHRKTHKLADRDSVGQLLPGSGLTGAGRPEGATTTTLARQHTAQAVEVLRQILDDERAPRAESVTAAQSLFDRGWGKSPVQIDLNERTKFDDFLRDVGLAANYERDHPVIEAEDATE